MDGDTKRNNKNDRTVQLEYNYDRLIDMKIIQAYKLLVPDKNWVKDSGKKPSMEDKTDHEASWDICKGIL